MSEEGFTVLAKEVAALVESGEVEKARCKLANMASDEFASGAELRTRTFEPIHEAISLLDAMVRGGEGHSEKSEKVVLEAQAVLGDLGMRIPERTPEDPYYWRGPNRDIKEPWFLYSQCKILGAFARMAVEQSPYCCPDDLEAVLRDWDEKTKTRFEEEGELGFLNLSWVELESLLRETFLEDGRVLAWNEPKSKHGAKFIISSRLGGPAPDDDIIDLDALVSNVMALLVGDCIDFHRESPPPGEREEE